MIDRDSDKKIRGCVPTDTDCSVPRSELSVFSSTPAVRPTRSKALWRFPPSISSVRFRHSAATKFLRTGKR